VDAFTPAIGGVFVLDDPGLGAIDLELVEARTIEPGAPASDAGGRRTPFSLLFRGPGDPVLPQRIYRLRHDALGAIEIFIVPVGRDAAGVHYEATFA
jgi:hypothetical protein